MKSQRRNRTVKGKRAGTKAWEVVKIVLNDDVEAHFRRGGAGWQSRINAALRKAAKLPKDEEEEGVSKRPCLSRSSCPNSISELCFEGSG